MVFGEGGARLYSLIKTHSEEPLKSPAAIMESLIGGHSAGKVFSGGGQKSFFGAGGGAAITLSAVCMKFMHPRHTCPPPFPSLVSLFLLSFFFFFF